MTNGLVEKNRIAKEYVAHYTKAAFIIKEGFRLPDDGLFSGFDAATEVYDKSTWNYQEGDDLSGVAASAAELHNSQPCLSEVLPSTQGMLP